jgi:hypothetical protein
MFINNKAGNKSGRILIHAASKGLLADKIGINKDKWFHCSVRKS